MKPQLTVLQRAVIQRLREPGLTATAERAKVAWSNGVAMADVSGSSHPASQRRFLGRRLQRLLN